MAADHYDAVIVGAGMVGAMCAYYATRAGLRVAVVERDQPAAGSSGACEGNLLLWDKEMEREFDLTRLSMREWHQVAEAIPYDFEYHHRKGGIMVIERPESMARAAGLAKELAATGVEVEELDAAALHEKEPSLAPDLAGGFFYPGDCQVEPRRAVVAVLRAAVDGGAELRIHEEVLDLLAGPDGVVTGLRTSKGEVRSPRVVIAAGSWSGVLGERLGLTLPITPRKGHVLVLERTRFPINYKMMEGGYLDTVQSSDARLQVATVIEATRSGTVLVGSSRNRAGFERGSQPEVLTALARRAVRFMPGLAALRVVRTYAGLRPFSADHLPLIGPVPGRPGLFVASGHEGAGICNSAATGLLISEFLTDKQRSLPDAYFAPARFAEAAL